MNKKNSSYMNSNSCRLHWRRIISRLTNPNKIRDIMLFTLLTKIAKKKPKSAQPLQQKIFKKYLHVQMHVRVTRSVKDEELERPVLDEGGRIW